MKHIFTALSLAVISSSILAKANDAAIIANLKQLGASDVTLQSSPIKGIKTAVTDQGILFVSDDGKYILQGKLYEVTPKSVVDMTTQALMPELEKHKNEMIVYPAKNEKHVITVFTDISCPYCHKFHEQIKNYNDLGITVRYLAFPRRGMDGTAEKMEAIFTADNNAHVLSEAINGEMPTQLKKPNIVKTHYELGLKFGVRGTPSIITQTGEVIGGYMPPKDLAEVLNSN